MVHLVWLKINKMVHQSFFHFAIFLFCQISILLPRYSVNYTYLRSFRKDTWRLLLGTWSYFEYANAVDEANMDQEEYMNLLEVSSTMSDDVDFKMQKNDSEC